MIAFDVVEQRGAVNPMALRANASTTRALKRGLILLGCGVYGETIRLLYPLTIPDAVLEAGSRQHRSGVARLSRLAEARGLARQCFDGVPIASGHFCRRASATSRRRKLRSAL